MKKRYHRDAVIIIAKAMEAQEYRAAIKMLLGRLLSVPTLTQSTGARP